LLRDFSVQSVASISPPDPLPTPAPDRKDKGSDSFSQMLDAAAQQPDNPAPEAGPPSGDQSSPAPRKTTSPPADDSPAQPQDDSAKASASCGRSAGDAPKTGNATADEKNSGKGSKPSAKDDGAKDSAQVVVAPDPAQAVVAPDPAQSVPQTGSVPAVLIALDAPKIDSGENAAAGGDCAKAAAAEVAATAAATVPAAPVAPNAATTVPVAPAASNAPKPSAGISAPANEAAAQAAAAIETAAKGAGTPSPLDLPAIAEDAPKDDAPKGVVNAVPAAKALADAAKSVVANAGGEPNPKPLSADKTPSGNAPVNPAPASAEEGKPLNSGDPASIIRLAAKAAPDSHAPAAASANQDLEAAVVRDVSATPQLAQSAALPELLRVLASTLGPASAPVQTPSASAPGVPATSAAIAVEIAARAKEGSNQFDIRLDPPELGRIDVRLDVDKSGAVSTRLTVDRPETLDLLQSDARGLERALQSAGLKTEDGSLQFSLRQQSPDGSAGQQAQGGTDPRSGTVYVEEDEPASAGLDQYQWAARQRGGVDIRV
jgi:flagellar hook-length control protein FliK